MHRLRLGLTTRGSALLTAGITAAVCGVALGQRDLVRVALLLIVAPLAAAVFVSRSRVAIHCARSVEPPRVPGGSRVTIRLDLTNQSVLPMGSLMLEDTLGPAFSRRARFTLDSLRGRETRSLAYQLPAMERGRYRVGPLQMRLVDPFGLVERTRSFRATSEFLVLPVVDELSDATLPTAWDSSDATGSHSVGSHGSDDASTREYRHGDDLRKVHWRSTARTGTVMVRQEERPWHGRTTMLLDTRAVAHRHRPPDPEDPDDDSRRRDSFEWAVSAVASAAAAVARRGRSVSLLTDAEPVSLGGPAALLDHLAALAPVDRPDLSAAGAALGAGGNESTVLAVLGNLDEVTVSALRRTRRTHGSALAVLLDTGSWTSRPEDVALRDRQRLDRVSLDLLGAGWRVLTVTADTSVPDAWIGLLGGLSPSSTGGRMPVRAGGSW